jgi:hypothetical protein
MICHDASLDRIVQEGNNLQMQIVAMTILRKQPLKGLPSTIEA